MEKTKRKAPPRRVPVQTCLSNSELKIVEAIAEEFECSLSEAVRRIVVAYPNSSASNN